MADVGYATAVAADFVDGLAQAGTTTALVFGAHFAPAVDVLFERAAAVGLRVAAGLVVSDRILRARAPRPPRNARTRKGFALAGRWHGKDRLRYAVTPRFSLSTTPALLEACAALLDDVDGALFTSHVNENKAEIEAVRGLFPDSDHYVDTYHRYGLVRRRSVLAHDVHPTDAELDVFAAAGASVAHCPSSNSALGSGLFPPRRHVEHGVGVALGTDVGAGTSFSLLREGLQACFMQAAARRGGPAADPGAHAVPGHARGRRGARAWPTRWATSRSAGSSTPSGCAPDADTTLARVLGHAADAEDALAKVFALAGPGDVRPGLGRRRPACAEVRGRPRHGTSRLAGRELMTFAWGTADRTVE